MPSSLGTPPAALLVCEPDDISLACHCKCTCEILQFIQLFIHPAMMHSNQPSSLCMPTAALLLCKEDDNSLACHCNHNYEFILFIQLYIHPAMMHSNYAWQPVPAPCNTAAMLGR